MVTLKTSLKSVGISRRPLSTVAQRLAASRSDDFVDLSTRVNDLKLQLEILNALNILLFTAKDLTAFFNKLADLLRAQLGYQYIYIWLKSEENKNVRVLVNTSQKNKPQFREIPVGIVGKVMTTKKTILVSDVTRSPYYFKFDSKTRSQLTIPLLDNENECLGAINIESRNRDFFSSHDVDIVTSIAPSVSHAIQSAKLYQDVLFSERRYKNLINTMNEAVWLGDAEGRTKIVNPNFEKLFGYKAHELLGKDFCMFLKKNVNEKTLNRVRKKYAEIRLGKREQFEVIVPLPGGGTMPVIASCAPTQDGGVLTVITDMRKIKEAEDTIIDLQYKEKYLATITQNSMDAIVTLDGEDIVQTWNIGAEQMFGYTAEEITGKSVRVIVPHYLLEKKESDRLLDEANEKGFVRNYETVRLRKNGEAITISLTYTAVKNEQGGNIGYSVIYRDITKQKEDERQLQERLDRMQEAYLEMGKQRRYLDYISDAVDMCGETNSVQHVANFIVNAVVMLTKVDACTLRLYRPRDEKLELIAMTGVPGDWWGKKLVSLPGTTWERAMKLKRPIKIPDITKDPSYVSATLARKNSLRSSFIIPFFVRSKFVGTLTLYLSDENQRQMQLFDDDFLTIFAQQSAVALYMANGA